MSKFQAGDSGDVHSDEEVFEVVIVDTTGIDPATGQPVITGWYPGADEDLTFEANAKDGRHYNVGNCAFWMEA